ncbi:MAG: glycosyltransferase [Wenzhouxiangellaceae bacterium]
MPRSHALIPATSRLGRITALILFLGLALGLVVPKAAGAAFLLLALIGIIWLEPGLARRRWELQAHERLLVFSVLAFVGVWLLAWLFHGLGPVGGEDVGRILRLLLIIPTYLFLARVDGLERGWWTGLAAGAAIAGGYAMAFAITGEQGGWADRVGGPTNPIYFGGIVLAISLMLLPRVADANTALPERLAMAVAVLLGLTASAMSGSRGAWLALPPLLVLYLVTLGTRQRPAWRFGVPLAVVLVAVGLSLLPGVPLGQRVADAFGAFGTSGPEIALEDTLAVRWALWQLSFEQLRDCWLFGLGPDGFRAALEQAVALGRLPEWFLEYHHPHNQFISALLTAGVPGLMTLALLFGIPLRRFAMLWQTGLERTRLVGWSGLAAISVLAVMALSESIFQRNSGIIWFALLTAAGYALVQVRHRRELESAPIGRVHTLSVIMICRDEADRIGNALSSVSDWADEIIVLDSGSTDGTVEICRRYTDRVEVTDWPGFGPQKQRALERATGDWVLSLDADEIASDELKREIDLILSRTNPHYAGYRLPWTTIVFGRELHFGHWARAPLRLVDRRAAQFTAARVHEKLVMSGTSRRTGRLEGPLLHHVFRDEAHARDKLTGYARLQAAERFAAGKRATRLGGVLRAAFNWLDNYLLRGAFLDGRGGWKMSALYARYTLEKYRELARLSK